MTLPVTSSPAVAYGAVRTAWLHFKASPTAETADRYIHALHFYNGVLDCTAI